MATKIKKSTKTVVEHAETTVLPVESLFEQIFALKQIVEESLSAFAAGSHAVREHELAICDYKKAIALIEGDPLLTAIPYSKQLLAAANVGIQVEKNAQVVTLGKWEASDLYKQGKALAMVQERIEKERVVVEEPKPVVVVVEKKAKGLTLEEGNLRNAEVLSGLDMNQAIFDGVGLSYAAGRVGAEAKTVMNGKWWRDTIFDIAHQQLLDAGMHPFGALFVNTRGELSRGIELRREERRQRKAQQ